MPYMRGDYYSRGDYTRGDPGFFGSLFHAVTGVVGGAVTGFLGGGPKGAIVGAVAGAGGAIHHNVQTATLEAGGSGSAYTPALRAAHAQALATHQAGGAATGVMTTLQGPGGMMPALAGRYGGRRMHVNKSTYAVRGGGTSHYPPGLALVVKGTSLVPNRRMNVANPRALRRSLRRVAGFAKLTKRVKRAVSMAASAVGVHHRGGKRAPPRKR
jgi:hypothetical protein